MLDHLKRKHDVADFIRLAVPNQLYLTFILKKQKAILVGQRLIGFDVADYLLLFFFGQA